MQDMNRTILAGLLAALLALPVAAQEAETQPTDDAAPAEAPAADEQTEAPAPDGDTAAPAAEGAEAAGEQGEAATTEGALGLSMGEEVGETETVGQTYTREEFDAWEMRCVRTETGQDPCQLYQLLQDDAGNNVAEISIFPLPEGEEAVAGATVITPLETLLTAQVGVQVDGGGMKRYPFSWCSSIGCFSRIGLVEEDVSRFRRGRQATLTIRPAAAPDQTVDLAVSLSGFTAGYQAVETSNEALVEQEQ